MGYSHRGTRGYLSGFGAIRSSGPVYATQFRATDNGTTSSFAFTWDAQENIGLRRLGPGQFVAGVGSNNVVVVAQFQATFGEGIQNAGGFSSTSGITPPPITGLVHDFAPENWNGARGWIRQDLAGSATITGLVATGHGHTIGFWNIHGAAGRTLTFAHDNAGSSAGNRFLLPNLADYVLAPCEGTMFIYDGTVSRWRSTGAVGPAVAGA